MATTFNKAPQQTFSREKIQAEGIPPDVMAFAQQATATQESITSARDIVSQSTQTFSEQDPTYTAAFTPEPPTYVSATEPLPISSSSTTATTAARSSTAPASSSLSKSPHRPLPTQFRPTLATRSSHHYAQASAASREERAWNQANALKKAGRGEMAGQGELGKGREGLGRGPSFDEQEYRRVMQRKSVALEGRGLGEMRAEVDGYSSGVGE